MQFSLFGEIFLQTRLPVLRS